MTEQPSVSQQTVLENQMLTNEVRHLRAQLRDAERKLKRAQRRADEMQSASAASTPNAPEQPALTPEQARVRELEISALDDMHWLVNRLDRSPLRVVLKNRDGFKTLKEKYGPDPRAGLE